MGTWLDAINADLLAGIGAAPQATGQRALAQRMQGCLREALLHGLRLRGARSAELVVCGRLSLADYALVLERCLYEALLTAAQRDGAAPPLIAYQQRVRALVSNLRANAPRLVHYDPRYLASATVDELGQHQRAAQERQQAREARRQLLRDMIEEKRRLLESDYRGTYRCNSCKSWKTTYYLLQTRSADEPMTCFITCLICGQRQRR